MLLLFSVKETSVPALSHVLLCMYPEPCALGPVSHCAEERQEVKVKVLPSAAGTRDWASLLQGSSCQTPLLCG